MTRRRKTTEVRQTDDAPPPANPRSRTIRFAIIFTVLVTLAGASELFLLRSHRGGDFQQLIADVVGGILLRANVPAVVSDTTVRIETASIEVALECTGIKATAIFCAGVLAFPCSWRARGIGIVTGLLGVGLLNIARIITLALVSAYRHDWFDQAHAVLMQGFLILFVAPLWIVWMFYANRKAVRQSATPS